MRMQDMASPTENRAPAKAFSQSSILCLFACVYMDGYVCLYNKHFLETR